MIIRPFPDSPGAVVVVFSTVCMQPQKKINNTRRPKILPAFIVYHYLTEYKILPSKTTRPSTAAIPPLHGIDGKSFAKTFCCHFKMLFHELKLDGPAFLALAFKGVTPVLCLNFFHVIRLGFLFTLNTIAFHDTTCYIFGLGILIAHKVNRLSYF